MVGPTSANAHNDRVKCMSESDLNRISIPTNTAKFAPHRHVENRRLFDTASGRLRLDEWEHDHLRVCNICEGVLCIMVSLTTNELAEGGEPPADAA